MSDVGCGWRAMPDGVLAGAGAEAMAVVLTKVQRWTRYRTTTLRDGQNGNIKRLDEHDFSRPALGT